MDNDHHQQQQQQQQQQHCSKCNKGFADRQSAHHHLQTCTYDIFERTCFSCGEVCHNQCDKHNHEKVCAGMPGPNQCTNCKKEFNNPSNRARHEKRCKANVVLSRKSNVECSVESAGVGSCIQNSEELSSVETASVNVCSKCSKVYKLKASLVKHAKICKGSRSSSVVFNCNECNLSFKCVRNLSAHVRATHSGNKLIKCRCSVCGKGFCDRGELTHHRVQQHGGLDQLQAMP